MHKQYTFAVCQCRRISITRNFLSFPPIWQGIICFGRTSKKATTWLLRRWVTRFYPILLKYGIRLVRDQDFAQDCLQDFFIDLWNRRLGLDDVQVVKSYLLLAYRRRLFREQKRSTWFNFATKLDDELDFESQFNIETHLIEHETEHENLNKLRYHLGTLTKRQREAIYLRFNQSMGYDEIAEIMSINHQSAVNLVYESLRLLRKNWLLALLTGLFIYF
ncbi:RNA polymerase sigma factor [Dyadobacter arcticus]|uniref:RNA polymerase sigma factor (Sigma-70 family) n=1 Tax=Dyadobacter arcticus TaxID=1078754 RepID=A0ABX0UNN4_9BACT|nr:sigma-70 family RNA polymerase sigma factor [Dyadobacter arcticus]NIJ54601.1 RNA polymerase sigma factor (sigma-70 family) [Dyadobacter arcticus]